MLKKLLSSALALSMCLSLAVPTFAKEAETTTPDENNYYISYDENGNIISYNMPFSLEAPIAEDHTYLKSTIITTSEEPMTYIGIHPNTDDEFRYVDHYYFSESETSELSISLTYKNKNYSGTIEFSASISSSFSYSVKVDQMRGSKLLVYCSYAATLWEGAICDEYTNEVIYTFKYTTFEKIKEAFKPWYEDETIEAAQARAEKELNIA